MPLQDTRPQMYDGQGDALMEMEHEELADRITIMPDALPSKTPDETPRVRIMWGQHLLEDLLGGRYRSQQPRDHYPARIIAPDQPVGRSIDHALRAPVRAGRRTREGPEV
jgi:hypothetical protein